MDSFYYAAGFIWVWASALVAGVALLLGLVDWLIEDPDDDVFEEGN